MNLLDLALGIGLVYYAIQGFTDGLIRNGLQVLGLLVGLAVANIFYPQLANLILPLVLGIDGLVT